MSKGSWSVASTIRAPRHQVDAFISHYLKLGADKVYVFFDDANFSDYDKDSFGSRVEATICDEEYWTSVPDLPPVPPIKSRPDTVEIRQHANMLAARIRMSSEWLLHVDVDELVYARKEVSSVLSAFPENVFSVVLRTLEAVYDRVADLEEDFKTYYFRRFTRNDSILSKFFEEEVKSVSWGGYWGVTTGKTFVRKSPEIKRMSVHRPVPLSARLFENVETDLLDMLHFEGQSYPSFKEKSLLRIQKDVAKLMNARFKRRLAIIKKHFDEKGEDGLLEAYKKFYVMSGKTLDEAISLGFVTRIDWDNYGSSSDALNLVSNPVHHRGQKISSWQGRIIKTAHSRYLSCDDSLIVAASDPAQLTKPESNIMPVEIFEVDGMARLLCRNIDGNLYATVQADKSILLQPDIANSSSFEVITSDNDGISLRFEGKYVCAAKDGLIIVNRDSASDWETFRIKEVYPQVSWF
ncbi:glycosyltransferase family 2 protein [Pseudomonas sp. MLB6B]